MATTTPQPAVSQRASGRVRKHPEIYTSSPFTSSSKRKRTNEEDVEDAEMPEDSEPDDDDDSDEEQADDEEIRDRAKKARKLKSNGPKRPAQKKTKVNGAPKPLRSAGGVRKKVSKKVNALQAEKAEAAGGLFAEVFTTGEKLETIAAAWLRGFDEHESRALSEVVNFVLKSAGCDGTVSEHDIEDPDGVTNKLDDLHNEYQATKPSDYPLIAKGKAGASFRHTVTSFMHVLVKSIAAKGKLFSNPELIENIQVWFSTMSSAPNRAFRHTATAVSLSIVTALCEVAQEDAQEAANLQRQSENERKKASANKGRAKQFEEKMKGKQEALEFVESLLKDWFDTVFIHRYRDVDPLIRRDCIAALGDWIMTMRDVFFDGQHLRYLGWVLSDTNAATRGEVIKQLQRLYKSPDMLGGLKTFTEKFRSRLIEIATTDAETTVRASCIELLDLLREGGLLEPDDIDAVGRLVYDTDVKVRKAVASFFAENVKDLCTSKIDDLGGLEALEEALPEIGDDDHDAPRLEWLTFKSLAEMLQSYDVDEGLPTHVERVRGDGGLILHIANHDTRFTLAADVLYHHVNEIKDWQLLSGYLLFDHSSGRANGVAQDALSQVKHECILSEKEEAILLEVLHASVKHALVDQAERFAAPKIRLTKKHREDLREELQEAVRHLANLLPRLLQKFGDAPSTAATVLRIESVLNLPSLQDLRQDSATYAALLDDVRKQFMSHGTDEVLGPASTAILHAKSYGELDDLTEEKVNALWDDVISNLTELIDPATVTVRGASRVEELVALSNNLLRIIRLATVSDCILPLEDSSVAFSNHAVGAEYQGAIDFVVALVKRGVPAFGPVPDPDEAAMEDEVAARAAEAALFYVRWKLKSISTTVTTSTAAEIPIEILEALATRRDQYAENLKAVLQNRKPVEDVCVTVSGCVLQLYSNSAILREVKPKPGMSDDYIVLVMDMDPDTQRLIMQAFSAAEKHYAKLSRRKLEEDSEEVDIDADPLDEDPMSDEDEVQDENEAAQTQTSQQGREAKMLNTLLAEQKLCGLVGRIAHALAAGVMDDAATRKRLERNKARLGPNFKECVAFLNPDRMEKNASTKARGKARKPTVNGVSKARSNPKSNAIVAEDEVDDVIEDADGDDEEALRRRELVDDHEQEPEQEEELVNGADGEVESVLGD